MGVTVAGGSPGRTVTASPTETSTMTALLVTRKVPSCTSTSVVPSALRPRRLALRPPTQSGGCGGDHRPRSTSSRAPRGTAPGSAGEGNPSLPAVCTTPGRRTLPRTLAMVGWSRPLDRRRAGTSRRQPCTSPLRSGSCEKDDSRDRRCKLDPLLWLCQQLHISLVPSRHPFFMGAPIYKPSRERVHNFRH